MKHHSIAIDNLRGLAVLLVIIYHYFVLLQLPVPFESIHWWGNLGVKIFFILSGYLIFSSYHKSKKNNDHALKQYFYNRVFRIIPGYYFSLLMMLLLVPFVINYPPYLFSFDFLNSILKHLTFTSYLIDKDSGWGLNGVYWSLSIEMIWYIMVPFLYLFIKQKKHLISLFIISLIYFILIDLDVFDNVFDTDKPVKLSQLLFWLSTQIPGQLMYFAMGILLYFLHIDHQMINLERVLDKIFIKKILYWLVPFFVILSLNYLPLSTSFILSNSVLLINSSIFCLAILMTKSTQHSLLTWMGKISYSLYLWHFPVLIILNKAHINEHLNNYMVVLIASSFILSLSSFSYYFVEKTGLELKPK